MNVRRVENMCGGDGHVIIKELIGEDVLKDKCKLYAEVTLEYGCEIGYHEHHGNSETYYIITGEGEYNDNGVVRKVSAGDVTVTKDGYGHALKNTGMDTMVLMALIINE